MSIDKAMEKLGFSRTKIKILTRNFAVIKLYIDMVFQIMQLINP